jgi:hypothetical protein
MGGSLAGSELEGDHSMEGHQGSEIAREQAQILLRIQVPHRRLQGSAIVSAEPWSGMATSISAGSAFLEALP